MNLQKKIIGNIFPYIISLLLIIGAISISFYVAIYIDNNLLIKLFNKFNVYKDLTINLDLNDIKTIQNELMSYLQGKSDILNTKVHIDGILTDFYSAKSKIHMSDVRNLFLLDIYVSYIAIVFTILLYNIMGKTFDDYKFKIRKAYFIILPIFLLIFLSLIIYANIDFNSFFTKFHMLFFNNDYWLFDPNEDYIIQLLPEELFFAIGKRIIIVIIIVLIFLSASVYLWPTRKKRTIIIKK